MRSRWMLLLAGLVAMVLIAPTPALAQDAGTGQDPEGTGIGDSIYLTGATITPTEGDAAPRTFDDYDAAVYVQSWLGCAFACGTDASLEAAPEGLEVFRVDAAGTWNGQEGNVTSYFATDGTTAYVAFPGLVVWTDPSQIPPPSQWFMAPARVIDAFNGEAELLDTTGTQDATSVPESQAPAETSGSTDDDSSSSSTWVLVGAAALLVLVGGALWWRRRSGGDDDDPTPTEPEPADSAAR